MHAAAALRRRGPTRRPHHGLGLPASAGGGGHADGPVPVVERPSDPARTNRAMEAPSQVMYIMADLGSGDPALAGLAPSITPLVALRADRTVRPLLMLLSHGAGKS